MVVYKVMVSKLDREWWQAYRGELRQAFKQDGLVVRAQVVEVL